MCQMSDDFKRLKVVTFVRADILDAMDGPDQQAACKQIWDDVETAINVACAAAGRVSIGDIALYEPNTDDVANERSGYYPFTVSVQTVPDKAAA